MTTTDIRYAAWQVIRVAGSVLWVLIRICLIFIIAVTIGSIKGAARSKTKTPGHD